MSHPKALFSWSNRSTNFCDLVTLQNSLFRSIENRSFSWGIQGKRFQLKFDMSPWSRGRARKTARCECVPRAGARGAQFHTLLLSEQQTRGDGGFTHIYLKPSNR